MWHQCAKDMGVEASGMAYLGDSVQTLEGIVIPIERLYLPKQEGLSGETEFNGEVYAKILCQLVRDGGDPKKLRLWWHIHPSTAFFSPKDKTTIEEFGENCPDTMYWISIVLPNQIGIQDIATRVDYFNPRFTTTDVKIVVERNELSVDDAVKAEFNSLVSKKIYDVTTGVGYMSNWKKDENEHWILPKKKSGHWKWEESDNGYGYDCIQRWVDDKDIPAVDHKAKLNPKVKTDLDAENMEELVFLRDCFVDYAWVFPTLPAKILWNDLEKIVPTCSLPYDLGRSEKGIPTRALTVEERKILVTIVSQPMAEDFYFVAEYLKKYSKLLHKKSTKQIVQFCTHLNIAYCNRYGLATIWDGRRSNTELVLPTGEANENEPIQQTD